MNTEDDEFNRIERESVARKMTVKYNLARQLERDGMSNANAQNLTARLLPEAIPFITRRRVPTTFERPRMIDQPQSPFMWRNDPRPSILLQDKFIRASRDCPAARSPIKEHHVYNRRKEE
jgi:hypothetical protein